MNRKRSKLTILLIISSFVFSGSVLLFVFGCLIAAQTDLSLRLVIISFITGILSGSAMTHYKFQIDEIMEYGKPVFVAAQHIKKVIEATNILGVRSLHSLVEASLQGTLRDKVREAEEKKEKGEKG